MPARSCIIGIDEVGRGPLAGPLCVGACMVARRQKKRFERLLAGIKDSKALTEKGRLLWFERVAAAEANGHCRLSTVFVREHSLDKNGLSLALKRAICRLLAKLGAEPRWCRVILDGGIRAPRAFSDQETFIKGDEREPLIAAASLAAKVRRDRYMIRLAKVYPQYGFERHKGYGTRKHYEALRKYGVSPVHRRSFLKNFAETIDR